jgi:hypothetical protein
MAAVEQSTGAVESYLLALAESYDSFSINQRTVTVAPERYEREHKKPCTVDVHAKVENEHAEVLHIEEEGASTLPSTTLGMEDSLEPAAKAAVSEQASITCTIIDIEAVTIFGVHNAEDSDCETLYRLAVLFEARHTAGTVCEGAAWKQYDPTSHPSYF